MSLEHTITAEASLTSKNLSKVALLRIAQYPFIALFAITVPRMMGPSIYGQYALFVSVVGMVAAILDLGITEIAARKIPELQQHDDTRGIRTFFSRMLSLKLAVDLLVITVFAVVLSQLRIVPRQYIGALVLATLVSDIGATAYGVLFGLNRMAVCSARDPLRRAAALVLVVVLYRRFGLSGAISSVVLAECLLMLINVGWVRHYISPLELIPSLTYSAPLVRYGLLFYLSWGVTNLWQRLGNTLINYLYHDFAQIAAFDLSNQIFLTATGFTLFLITALAPMFTRLRLDGKEAKLFDWSRRILTYNQIACMAGFAAWLLVGGQLVRVMIGPQYGSLYANVAILLCGSFPMVIVQLGLTFAMAYAEPRSYLVALCVAVMSFLLSSIVLVPFYGALGCSAATALSCFFCAFTIGLRYRTNLGQALMPSIKAIAIGAALLLGCWLYHGTWVRNCWLLLSFLSLYVAALVISRVIEWSEIRQAWLALRHRVA